MNFKKKVKPSSKTPVALKDRQISKQGSNEKYKTGKQPN